MSLLLRSGTLVGLLATTAVCQITLPPHSSTYNGFSRGFNFTSQTTFLINQLDLPLDAYQAGDTASYMVRVNNVEVLRSVGNTGAIGASILINPNDVVDVIGNWSPAATGNFTAHNSYGTGAPYNTMIEGVPHVLNRMGWDWDIGDPLYTSGFPLTPGPGAMGRVFVYTSPASGLHPRFDGTPTRGPSPLTVQFTDLSFSSDPNGIQSWAWDFDNDGTIDSRGRNPTHTYPTGGTYSVTLTVADSTHGAQQITEPDFIVVDPITAGFSYTPTAGPLPLTVQFTDTTVGNPFAWNWDLDGDGTVDSTAPNPAWTYRQLGRYSVTLNVTNGANVDTLTITNAIHALGATNNTRGAEILEYQFNETRGSRVANAASTTAAPSHGTVIQYHNPANGVIGWQADPGRNLWDGNDPGTGCLGVNGASPYQVVDTGWVPDLVGSHTISFWCETAGNGTFSYAFGSGPTGNSARCYHAGTHLSLRTWGSLPGFVDSATDPDTLIGWTHWCCVIDDGTGTGQWYLNGVPDGSPLAFSPGTFTYQSPGDFRIGGYQGSSSCFTRHFQMDDFRLYARALTPAEIATIALSESPAATTFGDACTGPSRPPMLATTGGAPFAGNGSFAVTVDHLEAGVPQVLNIGFLTTAAGLPFDLGTILPATHAGCFAQVGPDAFGAPLRGSTADAVLLPVPNDPNLPGNHIFCQAVTLGSVGAVSGLLDVNVQM